ncbi:MAG TPA: glycosyltransferase family 2 protein [Anaeromyxobacteraceae bacterium]|jgi:glycosyltransferase involved in cell wall biosynthesis
MPEERLISVVVPCHDGGATIGRCLAAALASDYGRFEVVVVDDGSGDGSGEIAESFPCKLVRLGSRQGVSRARNAGAAASSGELLFFIDADCLLRPDALSRANASHRRRDLVLGGTYTPAPHDRDFFSAFQSAAIHHFETKQATPDYVAAHAMVVDAELFRKSGGFVQDSFIGVAAGVEDVELCHRLRRAGCELLVDPEIQVQHVFRFSLRRSLGNAVRKARTWTRYSLANRDILADSGAASRELKANVLLGLAQAALVAASVALGSAWPLAPVLPLLALDLRLNRRLVAAWRRAGGRRFAAAAVLYYLTAYAAAVGIGAGAGAAQWLWSLRARRRPRAAVAGYRHA